MLHLARFAAIAVLVWFYMTAKEKSQPAIQWAIIGLIGYWITWWIVKLTVVSPLAGMFAKSPVSTFMLIQVPALCAIAAAFFIRKRLISFAEKSSDQD